MKAKCRLKYDQHLNKVMIRSFKDRQTLASEYNFRTLAKTLVTDTLT